MQHEITKPIPLLDDRGNLTEPGWARRPLPVYDRSRVKGGPARRKEWDYYLVMGEGFALALTIADSSCLGVASISLLDFQEGGQVTRSPVRLLPMGATGLPGTSQRGNAAVSGRGYALLFHNDGQNRTLTAHMERFREDPYINTPEERDLEIGLIFQEEGFRPNLRYTVNDDFAALAMVEQGLGVSIRPELVLRASSYAFAAIPLERRHYRRIALAIRRGRSPSPLTARFLECVRQWVGEHFPAEQGDGV